MFTLIKKSKKTGIIHICDLVYREYENAVIIKDIYNQTSPDFVYSVCELTSMD